MNIIIIYIFAINALTILAWWLDKRAAKWGFRRIPENSLLFISLLGGSVGGVIASKVLRHKTRKQPFKGILYFIMVLQIVALAVYINNYR